MKAFAPRFRQVAASMIRLAITLGAALQSSAERRDLRTECGPEGTPSVRGGYA